MRYFFWAIGLILLGVLGWMSLTHTEKSGGKGGRKGQTTIAPVEVAQVRVETIELKRTLTGTLESPVRFVVAPKVGGLVEKLMVDLADPVTNGQVVAELDDEEFQQEVAQAKAGLEVARANLVEAKSNLEIAKREMKRISSLQGTGVTSDSQFDVVKAELLTREAGVEVAQAQVVRAQASLAAAEVRLGYTKVKANWEGDGQRYVARRFVSGGDTIGANTALMDIVELDPIRAVVYVAERDYGLLQVGQAAIITTDAFPEKTFRGTVARVAPVFSESSRQARVELELSNPGQLLKPGMFVHAEVLLKQVTNATVVPLAALVTRAGQTGVFVVNEAGDSVRWETVKKGIRQDERVQVEGAAVKGRVVTLGQHLIGDGSAITIPQPNDQDRSAP